MPKIELGDPLGNRLGTEDEKILDDHFLQVKELEDNNIEEIKKEYDLDKRKDAFDEGIVPPQLYFFYGGENLFKSFKQVCTFLSPNDKNIGFVDFLCSQKRQNIVANNSFSIHVKLGNTFYQTFNTNEKFYSFFLAQQDETKSIVSKRFSSSYNFEKYIQGYLSSFSIGDTGKYDFY